MPTAKLQFTVKFIERGPARLRVLHADAGSDPDVALGEDLGEHLVTALPASLFGSHQLSTPARPKLPTLPLSVLELVLGRVAVPVGDDLAALPFYSWFCDLPTLVKMHDQLEAGGFQWPTGTSLEGLTAAIDSYMYSVGDLTPFHVALADTRQVEPPTPPGDEPQDAFVGALEQVTTGSVFLMGQPLGTSLSSLFHLSSRYRAKGRESGDFYDSLSLVVNSFAEANRGVKKMTLSWVFTQALVWLTRAELPRHLWRFEKGVSGSSCLRLVQFLLGDEAYREYSFESNLNFYLDLNEHPRLKSLLSDDDGAITRNPQPLIRKLGAGLAGKGETVPPCSTELFDFIEMALLARDGILADEANVGSAQAKVAFLLSTERRATGLAALKPTSEDGEAGAPSSAALASLARDLMSDASFQGGIAMVAELVEAGDATVNDFVAAAFQSGCMALVKHFLGKKKIPAHHPTLSLPGCLGMAHCLAAEMAPVSKLVVPLLFDLEMDSDGCYVRPDRLLNYEVDGGFLLNLVSGHTWDCSASFDLFGELVHRPDHAAFTTPVPAGSPVSFLTNLRALEALRARLPPLFELLFGYPAEEERGVAWLLDTAIQAVRNADRVVMCKDYLLHSVEQFLLNAFREMAALRRAAWNAPTLVAPRPPSMIPRDFRGDVKLASDMEGALEVARRQELMTSGSPTPPAPPPPPSYHKPPAASLHTL
jgi:hypothetical protein